MNSASISSTPARSPLGHAEKARGQSMGLWLNEGMIARPELINQSVRDLARSGYSIIRVMLRNTNFCHRSPQVVSAVKQLVATAHAEGLRVVLDCEPHPDPVARDMGNLFPDAIGFRVVRAEGSAVNGRFAIHVPAPRTMGGARADFTGVSAVFIRNGSTVTRTDDCQFNCRVLVEPYANGFTTRDHAYTEGRPGVQRIHVHLTGTIKGADRCQGIFYLRFSDPRLIDFSSTGLRNYYDQLLECYRDIPLDGVGWDEPATDGDWTQYLCGEAFLASFERTHGYKLSDKWYLLDEPGMSIESARVRLDYYRTLNEAVCGAQQHLLAKAREWFGPNILSGTHHTWQGEGSSNDYRAGAVDYFRLNDNMDAGYTDCWWWDFKSVCYAYTLGSSLGRLSPSGRTEVNTWDTKPTNSRVEYHARLMTLLDINWFNIWYGQATDTCLYPADYTWPATVAAVKRHQDGQRRIGGLKPVVDIAILHGWETVCGINRADIASAHKCFCLNTAEMLVNHSIAFDWIDTRLLAGSTVETGRLINALGSYSILILPYATVLPAKAWAACKAFAHRVGKVLFIGTPPEMDTQGHLIRDEFSELMGMPALPLETYLAGIDAACTLPHYRPQQLDVCYPLQGDRVQLSIEGEPNRMDSESKTTIYLTDLDPRERLLQLIEPWLASEVTCYSNTIQWRLYRDQTRALLVCIARQDSQLRGLVRWETHEIEFQAGTIAFIQQCNGDLTINGEALRYETRQRV